MTKKKRCPFFKKVKVKVKIKNTVWSLALVERNKVSVQEKDFMKSAPRKNQAYL